MTGQTLLRFESNAIGQRPEKRTGEFTPVLAGERLYVTNRNADVFVLRASPKFECVATNSIGVEPNASLAISDGNIFIPTDKQRTNNCGVSAVVSYSFLGRSSRRCGKSR